MKKSFALLLLALAILPAAACSVITSRDAGTSSNAEYIGTNSDRCPITSQPATAFVPPQPWPEQPPDPRRFWFGEPGLWTALPASGEWVQLADWDKFWLWSEEFDVREDETPDFVVTASRIDGQAPNFRSDETTNGYHPSWHWAMLTGVKVPTPGCWQFDIAYRDHSLEFVVWVPEPQPDPTSAIPE